MPVLSRSILRSKLTSAIVAGVVGITAVTVVSPGPAAASIPAKGYYFAVPGVNLTPGKAYSPQQVQQMQQAAVSMTMHQVADSSIAGPQVVTPFAVASGFVLYNPGYRRSAYVYGSDWGTATELYCSGSCTQVSKYQTQLHESITGGYSKLWTLKISIQHLSGNYASDFKWWYACAINVAGSPDHYCVNGADPSQTSEPMGSSGTTLYEYFENNSYANIEYPMVGITVDWGSTSTENKNRSWDVCANYSNTQLCGSSGSGS
jgi:hypothetical protein